MEVGVEVGSLAKAVHHRDRAATTVLDSEEFPCAASLGTEHRTPPHRQGLLQETRVKCDPEVQLA